VPHRDQRQKRQRSSTRAKASRGRRARHVGRGLWRVIRRELLIAAGIALAVGLGTGTLWMMKPQKAPTESAAVAFGADAPQPLADNSPASANSVAPVASVAPPAPAQAFIADARPIDSSQPAWLRNAVAAVDPGGRPMIAIVIDDLGLDRRNSDRIVALPGPLTLSFMTYAPDVGTQAQAAHRRGHELLVHVPMQPDADGLDAGVNVLTVDLPPDELARRIDWALSRFDGYVGINNHMGSRFTADIPGMAALFVELHRRGLLFLDSRTTVATVGDSMAARYDVPFARRNVFLDNEASSGAVDTELAKLEAVARRNGFAVAIGHPHDGTVEALSRWLPTLGERGFVLVPLSEIVKRNVAATRQTATN